MRSEGKSTASLFPLVSATKERVLRLSIIYAMPLLLLLFIPQIEIPLCLDQTPSSIIHSIELFFFFSFSLAHLNPFLFVCLS